MSYKNKLQTVDDVIKGIPKSLPEEELPLMPTYEYLGQIRPYMVQCCECGINISKYSATKKTNRSIVWNCNYCGHKIETLNWKETLKILDARRPWNRFCAWIKSFING